VDFERIAAIALINPEGLGAVLELVNELLGGSLPAWEAMRGSQLVPLSEGGGKVWPIAVAQVVALTCGQVHHGSMH
jgi:hypothetical protein